MGKEKNKFKNRTPEMLILGRIKTQQEQLVLILLALWILDYFSISSGSIAGIVKSEDYQGILEQNMLLGVRK